MCSECIGGLDKIERVESRASDARRAMGYNEIAFGNSRSRGRHAFASPISPRSPRTPGTARGLPTPTSPRGLHSPSSPRTPRTPRTPRGTREQQAVDMEHSASTRTSSNTAHRPQTFKTPLNREVETTTTLFRATGVARVRRKAGLLVQESGKPSWLPCLCMKGRR